MNWVDAAAQLPAAHQTVMARCSNGDIYQVRVCYGMHAPWWCGHSELNFGIILTEQGLVVTHWAPLPSAPERPE